MANKNPEVWKVYEAIWGDYKEGISLEEIASKYNRPKDRLYNILSKGRKAGKLPAIAENSRDVRERAERNDALVADYFGDALSISEIQSKYSVSETRMYQILNNSQKAGRCSRKNRKTRVEPSKDAK